MAKTNVVDMTKGNPLSLLIKFSIPLVVGSIFLANAVLEIGRAVVKQ